MLRANMVTPLKRTLFERRDFLSLLLAAPARIFDNNDNNNDGVTTAKYSQHGRIVQRLVTYQTNNNEEEEGSSSFTIFSTAFELKSILIALAEECHTSIRTNAWVNDNCNEDELPTKKRARGVNRRPIHNKNNNNLHSILKFVQRVIHQRYHQKQSNRRHITTTNEDEYYLEHEMKLYFGTKDVLFQLDEDILSLAFTVALDAIIHNRNFVDLMNYENTSESTTTRTTTTTTTTTSTTTSPTTTLGNEIINAKNNFIHKISQQNDQINNNNDNNNNIINTALQIIDYTVLASRRMRIKLDRIQQLQNRNTSSFITATNNTSTTTDNIINKRMKYYHLLNPIINQNDDNDDDDDEISCTGVMISVMEERYPQQWQWLYQFRLQLEEEDQKIATLLSSSSSNKSDAITETSVDDTNNFVIIRRKIEILDDISLSISDDDDSSSDEEPNQCSLKSSATAAAVEAQTVIKPEQSGGEHTAASNEQSALSSVMVTSTTSSLINLDVETRQLRLVLLAMPPSESASAEVVRHTVNEIVSLLNRYGELDGTTGIKRCGDILGGYNSPDTNDSTDPTIIDNDDRTPQRSSIAIMNRFPLTEAMTSSLVSTYLTDATGALRVKTFLHSFILPLMIELNPIIRYINSGGPLTADHDAIRANNGQGKPASRVLTSLLTSLARERPMECVASILVPLLVMTAKYILFEPNRFQCELISRVLRGKDAQSSQAIAFLVAELLPTKEELNAPTTSSSSSIIGGMKWTENTMPLLTACLICQPALTDDVVMAMSDMISYQLSSNVAMAKSIKFSTLFQTFVTKYGSQVKSIHKVESLLDSATRLRTFMSKTICLSLKKLV